MRVLESYTHESGFSLNEKVLYEGVECEVCGFSSGYGKKIAITENGSYTEDSMRLERSSVADIISEKHKDQRLWSWVYPEDLKKVGNESFVKFEYDFVAVNKDNIMSLLKVLEDKGYRWRERGEDDDSHTLPTAWNPYEERCMDETGIDIICLEDCGLLIRSFCAGDALLAVDWDSIKHKYIKFEGAPTEDKVGLPDPVRINVFTDLIGMKSNGWEIVPSNQKHPTDRAVMLKFNGKNTLIVGDNDHGYKVLENLGFKFKIGPTVEEVKRQITDAGREFDKENGVTCYIAETEEGAFSFDLCNMKPMVSEGVRIFFTHTDADMWVYRLNKAKK